MAATRDDNEKVSISQFYSDKSVLVTGGTGFIGKVLIEKLLWSCPGINKIYLLMRPKKGKDVPTRLEELLSGALFSRLRDDSPACLSKIVPIVGDVTKPMLGIKTDDRNILTQSVSVVFHTAATVKFDEALRLSVSINTMGTKILLELCKDMINLEALIHVSTAYCNCDREDIIEIIYPPPHDPDNILELMKWMSDDFVKDITPVVLGDRPNTYTFTKALAESVIAKECGSLPIAIVRPSIILGCFQEPFEGWVDNWNGASGLVAAAGKGVFYSMYARGSLTADLIPVDMVTNIMICAAWRTALFCPNKDIPQVYNCCTGEQNPITWKTFIDFAYIFMRKNPLKEAIWYPIGGCSSNWIFHKLGVLVHQLLPAYTLDILRWLIGEKPTMVRAQAKLHKAAKCLEYFTTHQWHFSDENVQYLHSLLNEEDKQTFLFDVKKIHWPTYLEAYVLGIRHYVFNEDPLSLDQARRHQRKLLFAHRLARFSLYCLLFRAFLRSSYSRKILYVILDYTLRLLRVMSPKK